MNRFQNGKVQDLQKPIPGCMGRMINVFDLSAGMTGTKLLTEKAHRDGSPVHKNRPDVVKKVTDSRVQMEDKPIQPQIAGNVRKSSSKKSDGTPMKMLIAQEMLRETECMRNAPNVVARLMGLDALPVHQMVMPAKRISREGYSHKCSPGQLQGYRQKEDSSHQNSLHSNNHFCGHEKDYKDVYEVWKQPSRNSQFRDQIPQKAIYSENPVEKRMQLVRQKFIEAKRLATDEKLLQSKEFQDALEVLSSNRDLFLKFLEEPNSLFSKHLQELQTIPSLSQTKRITVLKPSKTIEADGERHMKKHLYLDAEDTDCDMSMHPRSSRISNYVHPKADSISQPTRIVVLKPSPGKPNKMMAMEPTPVSSSKLLGGAKFYVDLGPDEALESREVAKEITRQVQEYLYSNRRDEALLSSALSNGYIGDESSFNRSENDHIEEGCGNVSDSETVTPTSRYSWDYMNRFGSPHSVSSFSRASFSPESSVIREAKKRLSERWAMVASNEVVQEQTRMPRTSSTLGEMLAIPEVKKEEESDSLASLTLQSDSLTSSSTKSCVVAEENVMPSASCLPIGGSKGGRKEDSTRNLSRSKSVPVSSSVYDNIGLTEEVPNSLISKSLVPKEMAKSKSAKSSFKEKVSSLFFSSIKKAVRETPTLSPCLGYDYRMHPHKTEAFAKSDDNLSDTVLNGHSEERIEVISEYKSGKASPPPSSLTDTPNENPPSGKVFHSLEKTPETSRENQDQPSPISVLDAPYEDDANINVSRSSANAIAVHPQALSRSTPIESIARTLTWNESHLEISLPNSLKLSRVLSKECEEQERFACVHKLLSSANLVDKDFSTIFYRWHSLESPLDPMLLDEFLDREEEEAKCREKRSMQKLLFDCVNAALLDIGQATLIGSYPWTKTCGRACEDDQVYASVEEEVWRLVTNWFSSEGNQLSAEAENRAFLVERVVKGEVTGKGWAQPMWLELDEFSKEIGGEVLEDLVEEALADLCAECLC